MTSQAVIMAINAVAFVWWIYAFTCEKTNAFLKYWPLHLLGTCVLGVTAFLIDSDSDQLDSILVSLALVLGHCYYARGYTSARKKLSAECTCLCRRETKAWQK